MEKRFTYSFVSVIVCGLLASGAHAQTVVDQRTWSYFVGDQSDLKTLTDFSNAAVLYDFGYGVHGTAMGQSRTDAFQVKAGATPQFLGAQGNASYNATNGTLTTTLNDPSARTTVALLYQTNVSSNFKSSFLKSGTAGGLSTLELKTGGNGFGLPLQDPNGLSLVDVVVAGDWTHLGTSAGDLDILSYNHDWTMTQLNFSENGSGGKTTLEFRDNHVGASSLNLDAKLFSPKVVPDPATYLSLGAGLVAFSFKKSKKKAKRSA